MVRVHLQEADRREQALEFKTSDFTDEGRPIKSEPAARGEDHKPEAAGAGQDQAPAQPTVIGEPVSLSLVGLSQAIPPADDLESDGCSTPTESPTVGHELDSLAGEKEEIFFFGGAIENNWAEQQLQATQSQLQQEIQKTDTLKKQLQEKNTELEEANKFGQEAIAATASICWHYATIQPITALQLSTGVKAKLLKTEDFD